MSDVLSARIIAFRKHVEDYGLHNLLNDCLELAEYVEAHEHRKPAAPDDIDAKAVWDWLNDQDIKLLKWQVDRFRALDRSLSVGS